MRICAIICEFNPFHNGHAVILRKAKQLSNCDYTVVVMSGQFTQRGEMCRTDKFLRAKHAILSGADAVIELPAHFAVAPAEIFAKSAIKLISSLGEELTLAFGCESGDKQSFLDSARILNDESESFKRELLLNSDSGESYIKSYNSAFCACGGDANVLSSPNNILGVEYVKAILKNGREIDVLPIRRTEGENADLYCRPAHFIRENADNPQAIKDCMPIYSFNDFTSAEDRTARFNQMCADALFTCDKQNLKRVYGCTEGLENRLKSLADGRKFEEILESATNKRYTRTRIRRILTANLLKLYSDDAERYLNSPLPLKILAVKKECADALLPMFAKHALSSNEGEECLKVSSEAYALWRYISAPTLFKNENEKMILV
ncbi:MAG: nucleotidyltransferase family protein [Candidatus Coproplasma sp.]